MGTTALVLLAAVLPAQAAEVPAGTLLQVAQEAAVEFDIPAQALDGAITAFGRQSGWQVSVDPAALTGRTSPGIKGKLAPQRALGQLLGGTGITWRMTDAKSVVLEKAPETGAMELGPVTVEGQAATPAQIAAERKLQSGVGYRPRGAGVASLGAESIIDTPRTVSVYTRELMDDIKPTDVNQIAKLDPAIRNHSSGGGTQRQFMIRGMGINVNSNYRQDGLVTRWASVPLENIEQIEVLKGTSALLYGFTTPGGVVNFVTKKPLDESLTRVNTGINQYGNNLVHADVSRVIDKDKEMGLRVNVAREGIQRHVKETEGERYMGAVAFDTRLGERAHLTLTADYQNAYVDAPNYWMATGVGTSLPPLVDPSTFLSQHWAKEEMTRDTQGAKLEYELSDRWKATGQVQRYHQLQTTINAFPGTVNTNGNFSVQRRAGSDEDEYYTSRMMLEGAVDTGPLVHNVTLAYSTLSLDREGHYPSAVAAGTNNLFNPVTLADPGGVNFDRRKSMQIRQSTTTVADRIDIGQHWSVLGAANHVDYDFQTFNYNTGANTDKYQQTKTSPAGALIFKPTDKSSIYASYAESLESGGTAPSTAANANQTLAPRVAKQREIGAKMEWPNGLLTTVSAFQMVRPTAFTNPTTNIYAADGKEDYRGIEISAAGQVTENLRLTAGYLYLDAEIKNASSAAVIGKTPQNVADHAASLFANYSLDSVMPGLSLLGGVNYVGERPVTTDNSIHIPGYTLFDVGLSYEFEVRNTELKASLMAENVADTRYWANSSYGYLEYGTPRTIRFNLQTDF